MSHINTCGMYEKCYYSCCCRTSTFFSVMFGCSLPFEHFAVVHFSREAKQDNEHKNNWKTQNKQMNINWNDEKKCTHSSIGAGEKKMKRYHDTHDVRVAIKTAQVHTFLLSAAIQRITKWHRYTEWQKNNNKWKKKKICTSRKKSAQKYWVCRKGLIVSIG